MSLRRNTCEGSVREVVFRQREWIVTRWDMARRVPKRGNVFVKVFLDDFREIGVEGTFHGEGLLEVRFDYHQTR